MWQRDSRTNITSEAVTFKVTEGVSPGTVTSDSTVYIICRVCVYDFGKKFRVHLYCILTIVY